MTALDTATDTGRTFWSEVLATGGSTAIPRWAPAPVPGTAVVEVAVPDAVQVQLRRLAQQLGADGYDVTYEEFDGGHVVRPGDVTAALALWLGEPG